MYYGERVRNWPCARCKQNQYVSSGDGAPVTEKIGLLYSFICTNCGNCEWFKKEWFDREDALRRQAKDDEQSHDDHIEGDGDEGESERKPDNSVEEL